MCRKIVATKEQLFNFLYEQVWAKNLENFVMVEVFK